MSIEYKDIGDWEVMTPTGWQPFSGIKKVTKKKYVKIEFVSGNSISCSVGHKLKRKDGKFVETKRLRKGTKILAAGDVLEVVRKKELISGDVDLYDLIEVENGHEYLSNGVISSNCAFIDGVELIWLSVQSTLSTGGKAIILSTPNGVGNFFHRMWTEAEQGLNEFNRISLPWHFHPERDQTYRAEQEKLLGKRGAAQECDCEFSTSGNTVIELALLDWFEKDPTQMCDPQEKRGFDKGFWIWKYAQSGRSYMVVADVGRGDAADFSACHVLDIETMEQVAEYMGKVPTKDYATILATIGTEYNQALLVVENANIGWAVIQAIIDMNYGNLFYSSTDLQYVDVEAQMTNKLHSADKKLVPGFTTSSKSRPLVISKLESYIRNKEVTLHSKRLLEQLKVFIWKQTGTTVKAEAMSGYNDDLVMAMGIALWIRDVALRLKSESDSLVKTLLTKVGSTADAEKSKDTSPIRTTGRGNPFGINNDPWKMQVGGPGSAHRKGSDGDLRWLL